MMVAVKGVANNLIKRFQAFLSAFKRLKKFKNISFKLFATPLRS
jgi:hypothetical protein